MPAAWILGRPQTSVLPALKPCGPKRITTRRRSSIRRRRRIFPRKLFHLIGPPVLDNDKYEGLSVQLEAVLLNGVFTTVLMKTLLDIVHKLSEDIALLKGDNASLKSQVNKLHDKFHQPHGSVLQCRISGKHRNL